MKKFTIAGYRFDELNPAAVQKAKKFIKDNLIDDSLVEGETDEETFELLKGVCHAFDFWFNSAGEEIGHLV